MGGQTDSGIEEKKKKKENDDDDDAQQTGIPTGQAYVRISSLAGLHHRQYIRYSSVVEPFPFGMCARSDTATSAAT